MAMKWQNCGETGSAQLCWRCYVHPAGRHLWLSNIGTYQVHSRPGKCFVIRRGTTTSIDTLTRLLPSLFAYTVVNPPHLSGRAKGDFWKSTARSFLRSAVTPSRFSLINTHASVDLTWIPDSTSIIPSFQMDIKRQCITSVGEVTENLTDDVSQHLAARGHHNPRFAWEPQD